MLILDGIHYPRATPEMCPDLIAKSKEGGVDVIQTYVFWSGHDPVREHGDMNFNDKNSWDQLFKDYWIKTKAKRNFSLAELEEAEKQLKGKQESLNSQPNIKDDNDKDKKHKDKLVEDLPDDMERFHEIIVGTFVRIRLWCSTEARHI